MRIMLVRPDAPDKHTLTLGVIAYVVKVTQLAALDVVHCEGAYVTAVAQQKGFFEKALPSQYRF